MTTEPQDGGPAFPSEGQTHTGTGADAAAGRPYQWTDKYPGMSLRDWFAGQYLAGFLASGTTLDGQTEIRAPHVSKAAYHCADAMLAERAKAK